MSSRTVYLSRLIGLFAIIMGLAMLVRGSGYANTMALIVKDEPLLFLIGVIALSAGLAIVLAHNVWSGSVAAVVITVAGYLSILRGIFILFSPGNVADMVAGMNFGFLANFYTVIFLIVGLYLTYAGFASRKPL